MNTILNLLDRAALALFNFLVIAGRAVRRGGAGHQRALVARQAPLARPPAWRHLRLPFRESGEEGEFASEGIARR